MRVPFREVVIGFVEGEAAGERGLIDGALDCYTMQWGNRRLAVATGVIATVCVLAALLLAAVRFVRERGRWIQSASNMMQLSTALLSYEARNGRFPAPASFDKAGKPLLSWRVHILPYLGAAGLYRQFRLDEPWDSAHNRALIPKMPPVFQNPAAPAPAGPGRTQWLAVLGEGLAFSGREGRKISESRTGTVRYDFGSRGRSRLRRRLDQTGRLALRSAAAACRIGPRAAGRLRRGVCRRQRAVDGQG